MPKELLEIKNFTLGIMTTPSETNIPNEAASYSLNVDPVSQDGKLQAMPDDIQKENTFGSNVKWLETIKDGDTDKRTVIAYVGDNGTGIDGAIHYAYDIEAASTPALSAGSPALLGSLDATAADAGNLDMELSNKELHIGFGTSNNAKWVGKIDRNQFGAAYTTNNGFYGTDAELKTPSEFRGCYKLVFVEISSTTYVYGIDWKGNRVYKFKEVTAGSSYTFEGASTTRFSSTQGICQRYVGGSNGAGANETEASSVLWVYDAGIGSFGSLLAYDPVADEVTKTFSVSSTNVGDDTDSSFIDTVSDILETEFANQFRHVFFSKRYENEYPVALRDYYSGNTGALNSSYGADNGVGIIYSTAEASFDETISGGNKTSTAITLVNRTPKIMATNRTGF